MSKRMPATIFLESESNYVHFLMKKYVSSIIYCLYLPLICTYKESYFLKRCSGHSQGRRQFHSCHAEHESCMLTEIRNPSM